jgi:uncharacterized membrane protein YedE/YeeE
MASMTVFLSGLLFACGLAVGGMTRPAKVLAFLDVAGDWDPSLAFVMVGAIAVHATAMRFILRRERPLFASRFVLPSRVDLEPRLIGGAALFGIGWGLAGYCPGPAVTALGAGVGAAMVFVPAMLAGMFVVRLFLEPPAQASVAPTLGAVR